MSDPVTSLDTSLLTSYGTVVGDTKNEKKIRYPISVFFIIVNEFCERFSFYGMKTVLTLYLRNVLLYDENQSTVFYHLFTMLCYFTPVFGAILADTYLGKFKTILYLSILYACGNIVLSVASIPNTLPQTGFSFLGLFIIAVGTGGIKPCVSAFGGDQFVRPQQEKQLEQFFSVFYFAINAGSLISTFVTPILRQDVQCFGQDSCFPLAFGVPAILMLVAVAVFLFGKRTYKIREPQGNIMVDVVRCTWHAVHRKVKYRKTEKHEHWLDFASDKFDKQLITDIKQVLRILLLYLPIPIFWALFDQQGSRWTFQATRMDGAIGSATIKPDQIQIINPLLVLALVPVFESLIYPFFSKFGLLTPLQRMGTGGILAAIAFIISGFIELSVEPTYPLIPQAGATQLNFINSLPCQVNLSYTSEHHAKWIEMNATSYHFERDVKNEPILVNAKLGSSSCGNINFASTQWSGQVSGDSAKAFSVVIVNNNGKLELVRTNKEEPLEKSTSGLSRINFIVNSGLSSVGKLKINGSSGVIEFSPAPGQSMAQTEVRTIDHGTYDVFVVPGNESSESEAHVGKVTIQQGGCYTIFVHHIADEGSNFVLPIAITQPNSVNVLWQIPQYFVMTVAEVMFSVTGLQFSFTQAPASMRSVLQACWLLTIAFGNVIVIIVAEAKAIQRQSMEFFLFAGLMVVDMLLFFYLAVRYTYVEVETNDSEKKKPIEANGEQVSGTNQGKDNDAFDTTST